MGRKSFDGENQYLACMSKITKADKYLSGRARMTFVENVPQTLDPPHQSQMSQNL